MILTLKPPHVMMVLGVATNNFATSFFVAPKLNIITSMRVFHMGLVDAIGLARCVGSRHLPLVPVEKPVFYYQKGVATMLQQANGHVLPQNYQIDKEQIFLGQKNFTIMGQVRVIFFEDANGELQAMIKFDQHSPELLKREGLVFAHFALADMVEREGLMVEV